MHGVCAHGCSFPLHTIYCNMDYISPLLHDCIAYIYRWYFIFIILLKQGWFKQLYLSAILSGEYIICEWLHSQKIYSTCMLWKKRCTPWTFWIIRLHVRANMVVMEMHSWREALGAPVVSCLLARYCNCFLSYLFRYSMVVSTFEQSKSVTITCRLLVQPCSCLHWGCGL